MRTLNLFFVEDLETRMAIVLFDHFDQGPHMIRVPLKQLAKVPAVVCKRPGDPEAGVLLRRMGYNIINILRCEMRARSAEIEDSDHWNSFLIGILPAVQIKG